MQKAQSLVTAIFGYVCCSGRETILCYANRTAFVDHVCKTLTVVAAKVKLQYVIVTASLHSNLFQNNTECSGIYSYCYSVQALFLFLITSLIALLSLKDFSII